MSEARAIVDWMARAEEDGGGGKRAEWVEGLAGKEKTLAWIWWRRPEEWAALIAGWVSLPCGFEFVFEFKFVVLITWDVIFRSKRLDRRILS